MLIVITLQAQKMCSKFVVKQPQLFTSNNLTIDNINVREYTHTHTHTHTRTHLHTHLRTYTLKYVNCVYFIRFGGYGGVL